MTVGGGGALPPATRYAGETVEGRVTAASQVVHTAVLDANDTDAPVRGERFDLEVTESVRVTIDLRSYFLDAYLVLLDADGRVVAEDDDGLLRTQSGIVRNLEAGRLGVLAWALYGGLGAFVLEVREGAAEPLRGPARAAAEIEGGAAPCVEHSTWVPNRMEAGMVLDGSQRRPVQPGPRRAR